MKAVVGTQVALDKMRGQVEVCIPVVGCLLMEAVVGTQVRLGVQCFEDTQVVLDKMRGQVEVCIPVVGCLVVQKAVVGTQKKTVQSVVVMEAVVVLDKARCQAAEVCIPVRLGVW